jgi:ribonuclease D
VSTQKVSELAQLARDAGRLGVDTEFVSERRYQALLCLVQVVVADPAAEGGQRIEIIDPIEGEQPGPLADVLADPEIEVVFHAARQDVALLKRTWQTEIRNIFDTQVAAGFAGLGAQTGYDGLVRPVLGVTNKGHEGFTRWERRPLTEEQVKYAKADVEYLLPLADGLKERLMETGRLEWAREECRALEEVNDERAPTDMFARLPRIRRLGKRQQALALSLVGWREEHARELDKPAGSIVPDHVLVEVARKRPTSRKALEEVRGMPSQTLHRWWRELLEAIEGADDAPAAPELRDTEPGDPGDAPLISVGQALVRQRAMEAGVATDLISTQADLAAVVSAVRRGSGEPDVRTMRGWRRELVGEELLELLAGRRSVRIENGRLAIEPAG